jgi:hypothetical protein
VVRATVHACGSGACSRGDDHGHTDPSQRHRSRARQASVHRHCPGSCRQSARLAPADCQRRSPSARTADGPSAAGHTADISALPAALDRARGFEALRPTRSAVISTELPWPSRPPRAHSPSHPPKALPRAKRSRGRAHHHPTPPRPRPRCGAVHPSLSETSPNLSDVTGGISPLAAVLRRVSTAGPWSAIRWPRQLGRDDGRSLVVEPAASVQELR